MDFAAAQQEIETILRILNEAKSYSGLGPNDPAVQELDRIMMKKVMELEAARAEAAKSVDAAHPDPAAVLFDAHDEDAAPASPAPEQAPK